MFLRHLQLAISLQRLSPPAQSGRLVREFKPRLMSSSEGPSPMTLQAKIQFLHDYSACDVRLYCIRRCGENV